MVRVNPYSLTLQSRRQIFRSDPSSDATQTPPPQKPDDSTSEDYGYQDYSDMNSDSQSYNSDKHEKKNFWKRLGRLFGKISRWITDHLGLALVGVAAVFALTLAKGFLNLNKKAPSNGTR